MAFYASAGTFLVAATQTGTFTVTDAAWLPGANPKGVILWACGCDGTGDEAEGADINVSLGFATGAASEICWSGNIDFNVATGNAAAGLINTRCVRIIDNAGSVLGDCEFNGWGTSGFTLNVTDQFPSNIRVSYLMVGGSDFTNMKAGYISFPSSQSGSYTYTDPGFDCDGAILIPSYFSGLATTSSDMAGPGVGFGTDDQGTNFNFVNCMFFNEAATADSSRYSYAGSGTGGECSAAHSGTATQVAQRARWAGGATSGFKLNHLETDATVRHCGYLAFAGTAKLHVDWFNTTTGTGTFARTGYGGQPAAIMVSSVCGPQSAQNTVDAEARFNVGFASSTTKRNSQQLWVDDGGATVYCTRGIEHDALYKRLDGWSSGTPTGTGSATLTMDPSAGGTPSGVVAYTGFGSPENIDTNDNNWATGGEPGTDYIRIYLDDAPTAATASTSVTFVGSFRIGGGNLKRDKGMKFSIFEGTGTSAIASATSPLSSLQSTEIAVSLTGVSCSSTAINDWQLRVDAVEGGGGADTVQIDIDYAQVIVNYQYGATPAATYSGIMDLESFDSDGLTMRMEAGDNAANQVGVFAFVPGSTLSQVNKDVVLVWDILEFVNKDLALQWDILNLVNKDLLSQWDIFSVVNKDVLLQWDIAELVNKDLVAQWDISEFVYKDLAAQWDILNHVNKDVVLQWDILNLVNKDLAAQWDIAEFVYKDLALQWDMSGRVNKDLAAQWDILNFINKDLALQWDILNLLNKDLLMTWDILNLVNKDLLAQWDMSGVVSKDLAATWDILDIVNKDMSAQWDILEFVNKDLAAQWDIWNFVNKDLALQWDMSGTVNKDLLAQWDIESSLSQVNKDLLAQWDIRNLVNKDLQAQWDILILVNKDLTATWDIAEQVYKDLVAQWDIGGQVNKDLVAQWDMAGSVNKDLVLEWDILSIGGGRNLILIHVIDIVDEPKR